MQSNSSDDPLQDLALVKEILQRQEDRVILPPWAWYFWALVVALGTAVSVVAVGEWGWTHPQVALRIWPVVVLVGSISETAGWVRFFRRDDVVALTRANIRMVFSFFGVGIATGAIIFSQILRGYDISAILLPTLSLYFFMIAVFSFRQLFWEGYAVVLLGVLMMVLPIPAGLGYPLTGALAAAAFVTGGVHTAIASRRYG